MPSLSDKTLYIRLGEQPALNAAIEALYQKIMRDKDLAPFFADTNIAMQRLHMRIFLTYAFGGAPNYTGRNLGQAHARLVKEKGLNDKHFDRVAGHLRETLQELDTQETLIQEVLTIVDTTRDEVLNR